MRDQKDGACGHVFVGPEFEQFAAQVVGGEHVEGAEGLVHEQDFGFDDQRAGKADTLLHAARKLLGIGGLKAVQADRVEHLQAARAALLCLDAASLQGGFHIFKNREPGKEREALKDDRDVDLGFGNGALVPVDLSGGGRGKSAQHAQHGRFSGARRAKQRQNLTRHDAQIGGGDDLNAVLTGLLIVLFYLFGADDGLRRCRSGRGFLVGEDRWIHGCSP